MTPVHRHDIGSGPLQIAGTTIAIDPATWPG